jgi:hypothetical protein
MMENVFTPGQKVYIKTLANTIYTVSYQKDKTVVMTDGSMVRCDMLNLAARQ